MPHARKSNSNQKAPVSPVTTWSSSRSLNFLLLDFQQETVSLVRFPVHHSQRHSSFTECHLDILPEPNARLAPTKTTVLPNKVRKENSMTDIGNVGSPNGAVV